jgi:predicted RNase H-like HicB family nuclease
VHTEIEIAEDHDKTTGFNYFELIRMRSYTAIVERCQDTGLYVGFIPGFQGAHTQAETLDELNQNLREVVEMLLEDGEPILEAEFIGTQNVVVA